MALSPSGFGSGRYGLRRAGRKTACRRMPLAAVLGQVGDQRPHAREVRRVDERTAVALDIDEAGMLEVAEMEGERWRREIETFSDLAGGDPAGPRLDQEPEDVESRLVRQTGEGGESVYLFHISSIVEFSDHCQRAPFGIAGMFGEDAARQHVSRLNDNIVTNRG